MDLASLCGALALSAAAGLNAWLPLFGQRWRSALTSWSSPIRSYQVPRLHRANRR